jgi:hypothetical protein
VSHIESASVHSLSLFEGCFKLVRVYVVQMGILYTVFIYINYCVLKIG